MAEVATAYVTLLPSARGFGTAINRQVGPQITKSGTVMGAGLGKSMLKGFIAIGAITAITGFVKGAVTEGREAQKVSALTDAAIKSTGGVAKVTTKQIERLANSLSQKIGVDDEAIQSASNMLLTFTKVRNEVGKGNDIFSQANVVAQDMAVTFRQDGVTSAKQLGKALQDPIRGVAALSRTGIVFSEQQREQIKTLVESGKTLKAQKLILAEVKTQTEGAAEATATYGDKSKVAFDNIKEQIGTALLPALDSLGKVFVEKIAPAISGFITNLQSGKGEAGKFGAVIREQIVPALKKYYEWIFLKVVPAIRGALTEALKKGREAFDKIRKAVKDNEPELRQLWNWFKKIVDVLVTKVIPFLIKMQVKTWPLFAAAVKIVISVVSNAVRTFNSAVQILKDVKAGIDTVAARFKLAAGKITLAFRGLPAKLEAIGVDIVLGLVRGISKTAGLITAAVNTIVDKIPVGIRKQMGMTSPSKVTQQLGEYIGEGLAKGIAESGKKVSEATQKVIDKLKSQLSSLKDDFRSLSESVAGAFTGSLFEAETAGGFIANLLGTKGQLTQLKAAFKKLIGFGLNPAFLSQLFASGNGGLILDLAAGSKAQATQAASLFGQVNSLSSSLGNQVAKADIGPKIDETNRKLDQLIKETRDGPKKMGKEINGAARSGRQRAFA